jgi:hypothetical protein
MDEVPATWLGGLTGGLLGYFVLGRYGIGVLRDTFAPALASFPWILLIGGLLTFASAGAGVWLALRSIGHETPMRKAVAFALTALVVVPLTGVVGSRAIPFALDIVLGFFLAAVLGSFFSALIVTRVMARASPPPAPDARPRTRRYRWVVPALALLFTAGFVVVAWLEPFRDPLSKLETRLDELKVTPSFALLQQNLKEDPAAFGHDPIIERIYASSETPPSACASLEDSMRAWGVEALEVNVRESALDGIDRTDESPAWPPYCYGRAETSVDGVFSTGAVIFFQVYPPAQYRALSEPVMREDLPRVPSGAQTMLIFTFEML